MVRYRRNFVPGGSFFFTVNLAERRLRLLTENIGALRAAFRSTRAAHPFDIEAIVVLPDHLHAVWSLPEDDYDYATRWRLIKSSFSRALPPGERISDSRRGKSERGIWQRRYWEHTLHDERDFARHMDYIHFNPVKHGHVTRVADWPHSSFHRMVRDGIYPLDWAGDAANESGDFGERSQDGLSDSPAEAHLRAGGSKTHRSCQNKSDGFRKGSTHPTRWRRCRSPSPARGQGKKKPPNKNPAGTPAGLCMKNAD